MEDNKEFELNIANKVIAFQNREKEMRAAELVLANKELAFQNHEKEKRAEELAAANIEVIKADEELRLAHERLFFHFENTPLGFIEWDKNGHVKFKSKKAEQIFGWTLNDFYMGERTAFDQVYADDLPLVQTIVKQLMTGEVVSNKVTHRNVTKDGRII